MRILLSPRAHGDIEHIWQYSAQNWGIEQAELYIRQIAAHIEQLSTHPHLARPCPEIRPGYAKYRTGAHFLYLRRQNDALEVIRILHESMDVAQHL